MLSEDRKAAILEKTAQKMGFFQSLVEFGRSIRELGRSLSPVWRAVVKWSERANARQATRQAGNPPRPPRF